MACPYFYPLAAEGPGRAILPLGDRWRGECRAGGGPQPDTSLCNMGYARGCCARFPQDGPDAVRFSVARHAGGAVAIRCVLEKDHLPFWHGTLQYSVAGGIVECAPGDVLARQAAAYAESYLRRKERR